MPVDAIEERFESIESAYEFMAVLADTILSNVTDLRRDYEVAIREEQDRRARAIELAIYKCKSLNCYVAKSRRTLNDLRTIRRLILNERLSPESVVASVQNL